VLRRIRQVSHLLLQKVQHQNQKNKPVR